MLFRPFGYFRPLVVVGLLLLAATSVLAAPHHGDPFVLEQPDGTEVPVLIEGETGTGKELVAHAVCQHSRRAQHPFVVIDCGAIPGELMESELFGHRRGAFTGAANDRHGAFHVADGGTVFLEEIGEMPVA